jgi:hypothetical protein
MPLSRLAGNLLPTLLVITTLPAFASGSALEGRWVINHDLTSEIRPDNLDGDMFGGFEFDPHFSIAGIPLPTGTSQPAPETNGSPKNPDILQTQEVIIQEVDDWMMFTFTGVGKEKLKKGKYRGTKTRWSDNKLTSSYESTSRKVSMVYEIRKDGRLMVSVKLNPRKGSTRQFKRVFDRADAT